MVSGQVIQAQHATAWLGVRNNKTLRNNGGSETSDRIVYAHSCPDSERAVISLRTPYVPASDDEGLSQSPYMLSSSGPSRSQSPHRSATFVGKVEEWHVEPDEVSTSDNKIGRHAEDLCILELKQRIIELQTSNAKLEAGKIQTQQLSDSFSWQEMLDIFSVFKCVSPLQYLVHAYVTTMASMPSPSGYRMAASTALGKLQMSSYNQSPLCADQTLVNPSVETPSSMSSRDPPVIAPTDDRFNAFEAVITNNAYSSFTRAQLSAWSHDDSKTIDQFCTRCQLRERICSCPWGMFGVVNLEWRTTTTTDMLEEYCQLEAAARLQGNNGVTRNALPQNVHANEQCHQKPRNNAVDAPENRPTSQEDLVREVQSIYKSLKMVDEKCLKVLERKASNKRGYLSEEQWQALTALHRVLLDDLHEK